MVLLNICQPIASFYGSLLKGHLISKANCQAVVSPKKRTKGVSLYYVITLQVKKSKFVCLVYLENLRLDILLSKLTDLYTLHSAQSIVYITYYVYLHIFHVSLTHCASLCFTVSVVAQKDVPPFGPPLNCAIFDKGLAFKDFLLSKLINGERAAYQAQYIY